MEVDVVTLKVSTMFLILRESGTLKYIEVLEEICSENVVEIPTFISLDFNRTMTLNYDRVAG